MEEPKIQKSTGISLSVLSFSFFLLVSFYIGFIWGMIVEQGEFATSQTSQLTRLKRLTEGKTEFKIFIKRPGEKISEPSRLIIEYVGIQKDVSEHLSVEENNP